MAKDEKVSAQQADNLKRDLPRIPFVSQETPAVTRKEETPPLAPPLARGGVLGLRRRRTQARDLPRRKNAPCEGQKIAASQ